MLKRRCCAARLPAAGRVVSAFRVRCIRSCRPFCSGCPGSMSSGRMPRRTHHAESFDRRANVVVANGTPLSLRIRVGNPYSWNSRVKIGLASSTAVDEAKPIFTRLFHEYGLPTRMRSDNGVPFATTTLARLSKLSAWWVRLGILPELIEPGHPEQNGRHERMHRTLKAETTRPAAGSLAAQQRRFNIFREEFNHERPHEALDQETPASCYTPSPRPMPDRLPPLEYPDRLEVRYVSANGGIRWNSRWVNVSIVCVGEYVGLEEIDDGIWNVYFGPLKLGRLHERRMRIEDAYGRLYRHRHV